VITKVAALVLLFPAFSSAVCIPFAQAQKHIGETQCVSGKVLQVRPVVAEFDIWISAKDHQFCPFSAVIFSYDLKNVGDVRQLEGKTVEIRGEAKEYDGRAEIILENSRQLGGEAVRLLPLQRSFDLEEEGHFSAGKFRASKRHATRKKKQSATLPIEVPEDAESD
jgi:hypothetical protein